MYKFHMRGFDLVDSRNIRLGTIRGDRIVDKQNKHIATVDGDKIMNAHRSELAHVKNDFLCDKQGRKKVAMSEIRSLIDADAINDGYLAALWMAFCIEDEE